MIIFGNFIGYIRNRRKTNYFNRNNAKIMKKILLALAVLVAFSFAPAGLINTGFGSVITKLQKPQPPPKPKEPKKPKPLKEPKKPKVPKPPTPKKPKAPPKPPGVK
jgi:hypothetical protein